MSRTTLILIAFVLATGAGTAATAGRTSPTPVLAVRPRPGIVPPAAAPI